MAARMRSDRDIYDRQSFTLRTNPEFRFWMDKRREAMNYLSVAKSHFAVRDENAAASYEFRHGLRKAVVPPSHREVIADSTSKQPNEILARLVSVLTAVFPKWIYKADGLSTAAGLRAAEMSMFARSLFMALEDRHGLPLLRLMMDEALSKGGSLLKVMFRLDRWANLPIQEPDESPADYRERVRAYKAVHIPFDITIPSYEHTYFDITTDGMVRVAEEYRASVYDIASEFGGHFDENTRVLHIPVSFPTGEYDADGEPVMVHDTIKIPAQAREVDYVEYWHKGQCALFCVNDVPIHYQELDPDLPLPYFLSLGEVTSDDDPGRIGLPILYNAFEEFDRKNNLRAMEDAFLWKHGFARMVRIRKPENIPGVEEPDQPDQEDEEEVIGEMLDLEMGEDARYIVPANVSALFADAKADIERSIDQVAMADVMSGRIPPSGTTGYLFSQLIVAATAKYVPILQHQARGIRMATNYIFDLMDKHMESEVVVNAETEAKATSTYAIYKPGASKGNRNLEVRIDAPLPSDIIPKSEWLMKGYVGGFVTKERVQREGFRVEDPDLEDEKRLVEDFKEMTKPLAMLRAQKRAGQFDLVIEAAQAGMLPPPLQQLAMAFATGPDGAVPTQRPQLGPAQIAGNPNGVISPQPGSGQSAVPTTGATVNAAAPVGPTEPV